MVMMVVWTLLALATALVVLVVASVADGRTGEPGGGVRGYLQDLRAGRRLRVHRAGAAPDASSSRPETPVDTSLEEFFAATQVHDPAYVAVEDLTETLARARERAARGVSGLARR